MFDPFPHAVVEGDWNTIRSGHEIVFLGGDRLLDWQPATGGFRIWRYDRNAGQGGDPLPHTIVEGQWDTVRTGHHIIRLGGDHLLFWDEPTGRYRVFRYDRNAVGSADPIPGDPIAEGYWGTITTGHELVSLEADRLLDWTPDTGDFRIWQVGHQPGADPLPRALVEGNWTGIRAGHRLFYLGGDHVLDWEPASGRYHVWWYDRSAIGAGRDPLPSAVASGEWGSIRAGHELVPLDPDRVLDWEPPSGRFRIWQLARP